MEQPLILPAYGRGYGLEDRLRETDKRELSAVSDRSYKEILDEAVAISHMSWAVWRLGKVQALFGVADVYGDREYGSIWLLTSDDIYNYRKRFMREARHYVARMHRDYPVLGNFVDDRNRTSQAWLRRLGFQPGPSQYFRGHSFTYFSSTRHV